MSREMKIELIPLGEPTGYAAHPPVYWNDEGMIDYARANVIHHLAEKEKENAALRHHVAELQAEIEALRAKLEHNRCNNGHETLPLTLWDCPECHENTRRKLRAAEARAERLAEALREMREYVTSALLAEREAFAGHEDSSDIPGIEADLHKIDALLRDQEGA